MTGPARAYRTKKTTTPFCFHPRIFHNWRLIPRSDLMFPGIHKDFTPIPRSPSACSSEKSAGECFWAQRTKCFTHYGDGALYLLECCLCWWIYVWGRDRAGCRCLWVWCFCRNRNIFREKRGRLRKNFNKNVWVCVWGPLLVHPFHS